MTLPPDPSASISRVPTSHPSPRLASGRKPALIALALLALLLFLAHYRSIHSPSPPAAAPAETPPR